MARQKAKYRFVRRPDIDFILACMVLFVATGFVLLGLSASPIDTMALSLAVAVPLAQILLVTLVGKAFKWVDKYLLLIVTFLCGFGLVLQYRLGVERAIRQVIFYGAGIIALVVAVGVMRRPWAFTNRKFRYGLMIFSLLALGVTIVIGANLNGATNWIRFGNFSIQPSEFVKILLPFVLAGSFTGKRSFVKSVPCWIFVALCILLLLIQRDLGAALIYFLTAVIVYFVATSDWKITLLALLAGCIGAVVAYHLFSHVQVRVAAWRNPWAPAAIENYGYQIVQGLMAIGSGGLSGLGLTLGSPKSIPLYYNDFIFAALCEEFGMIVGIAVVAMYVLLVFRGMIIALSARESFYAALALGFTVLLGLQTFIIIGGVIGLIPLTGVTLPFVSYGGSSLLASLIMVGILEGIAVLNGKNDAQALSRARQGGMLR